MVNECREIIFINIYSPSVNEWVSLFTLTHLVNRLKVKSKRVQQHFINSLPKLGFVMVLK